MERGKCYKCGQVKLRSEFYRDKSKSSGYSSRCKDCHKKMTRARAFRERSGNSITTEEYNRLHSDSTECPICKNTYSTESRYQLKCLDHDHATGKIRNFICTRCNLVLGLVGDSTDLLSNLTDYLNSH